MGILKKLKMKKPDDQKVESTKIEQSEVKPSEVKTESVGKAPPSVKVVDTPKKKTQKKVAVKKSTSTKGLSEELSDIILRPLVTEKSAILADASQYIFVVSKKANRIQVRSAIRALYGITPESVNIQNVRGKVVRFGRKKGKRIDWKKAIITMPKGTKIDVYEGV